VHILIKRDDQTGLALGGNKVRKLEFLIADALAAGADTVITTGGSQSNHARLTAAACRRAGLACHLVLSRGVHPEPQGNLLLDALFGAHIQLLESEDAAVASQKMNVVAQQVGHEGRVPYIIPRGGSVPAGATGYAAFVPELLEQLRSSGLRATHLYLGTGSCGTHSGVLAGVTAVRSSMTVQGISVSHSRTEQVKKVVALSNATLAYLEIPASVVAERILVDDDYRGPGYGVPTPETMEAISVAALDEGLVLDPVYTGKAMAGLIGHARDGRFGVNDVVVFLHTGGSPAIFAYNQETAASLQAVSS
jgi:D-cysteine desulfhydrase family pyridoxal phosphate-dependent enzyme